MAKEGGAMVDSAILVVAACAANVTDGSRRALAGVNMTLHTVSMCGGGDHTMFHALVSRRTS